MFESWLPMDSEIVRKGNCNASAACLEGPPGSPLSHRRVHWAPGIPRAPCLQRGKIFGKPRAKARRENANRCPVIARSACDEAVQPSRLPHHGLLACARNDAATVDSAL